MNKRNVLSITCSTPQFSTLAFTAALMAAGMLGFSSNALSGGPPPGPPWSQESSVTGGATDNQDGTWDYDFTVHNDSVFEYGGSQGTPIIVDWEIPWFGDAGISMDSIHQPTGWSYTIEDIDGNLNENTGWEGEAAWQNPGDPFYFGDDSPFTTVTQVLHWFVAGVECGDGCFWPTGNGIWPIGFEQASSAGLFGFTADFGPTDAPYQASWAFLPVRSGDPPIPGFPNSPAVSGISAVPEPASLALMAIGLAGFGAGMRRRRSNGSS